MELDISVCTEGVCKVYVNDSTKVSAASGYLPESVTTYMKDRFKYSETSSIDVVHLMRFKDVGNNVNNVVYTSHSEVSKESNINIPIKFDGVFNIVHLVLPTKEWFLNTFESNAEFLEVYDILYYTEGTSIYKSIKVGNSGGIEDWSTEPATIDELIERNTEGSTISRTCKTYVSVCYLTHCYISLCKRIFDGDGFSKCSTRDSTERELSYKRDLVWMTLNVIKYMVEFNDLQEAQRLIESIGGCNGLCEGWYNQNDSPANCGCGCG